MIDSIHFSALLTVLIFAGTFLCWMAESLGAESLEEKARRIHAKAIVIDTHSDTTMRLGSKGWDFMERHDSGHMDYPRIREGGLDAVFLAVYMGQQKKEEPGIAVRKASIFLDRIHELVEINNEHLELCLTAADLRRSAAQGKLAILIGIEGGHIIDNDLAVLRTYFRLGARYLTLTHTFHHDWADSSGWGQPMPAGKGGLTDFGRDVVREMNRIGMIVDISHVSDETFFDTLEVSQAPILASHSGCRAICDHPRNLSDEMLQALAKRGGVVQIVFFPGYLDSDFSAKRERARKERQRREAELAEELGKNPPALEKALEGLKRQSFLEPTPLGTLVDHIDHVIRLVGADHVGLGGDWDGVPCLCEGVEDCSGLGRVTLELLRRGHSEETILKVLGENVLRLMEAVECEASR